MKSLSNLRAERLLFWAQKYRAVLAERAADPAADPAEQYPRQLAAITQHINDAQAELSCGATPEPRGMRNSSGIVD